MRTTLIPVAVASLLLVAAVAAAQDEPETTVAEATAPEPSGLAYLGLNDQGAEEWYRASDHAVVVRVPRGEYMRRPYEGTGTTRDPEAVLVESFFVDKFEVTNEQFARFLNAHEGETDELVDPDVPGIESAADGSWTVERGLGRHPVTAATGIGALAYADWVGASLPHPEQWEKAAGGPEGRIYPWGDEAPDAARANFGRPEPRGPAPVGSHAAGVSPYGCHDMAGNVYDRVIVPRRRTRDGGPVPAMLKGGSWVSAHPLNLRVLDMCMQPLQVAERSVGFRCVMDDSEPERATRTAEEPAHLKLATDFDAAVAEAKERRVPIFLSLLFDTCGQCDRTREQCYRDPRFVAWANENVIVVVGHAPGDAMDDPHPELEGGACSLYPGITCEQHLEAYRRGIKVVGSFGVSPGNFVLHPDRVADGAGREALLAEEYDLPKWGNAVESYIDVLSAARTTLQGE